MNPSIPQFRVTRDGLYSAGQPAPDDWRGLADAGVDTVINLRSHDELGERDESEEVRAAGLAYVNIPVDGTAGLTREAAERLWSVLGGAESGVLVHCGTGNRVGALLALSSHWFGGLSAAQALDFGKAGGLASAEPAIRQMLGLPD